jgi:hypothetical protein
MKVAQLHSFGSVLLTLFVSEVAYAAPIELGKVKWSRDYDATLATAVESEKPVLILFQEVPG